MVCLCQKKLLNCNKNLCKNKCCSNLDIINGCYPINEIQPWVRSDPISKDCKIFKVGMSVNLDPEAGFNFIEGTCLKGYDVIISQIIAKILGKKLIIVDIPFPELIDSLLMGKIDMLASQMNKTTYRSDLIAQIPYTPALSTTFNLALLTSTYNLIKDTVVNNDWIAALNQLGQSGIAVNAGTTQEHYLLNLLFTGQIPNLSIVLTESNPKSIELIKNGYVVGYLVDTPVARDDPEITNVNTAITIPSEIVGDFAIAVNIQCCDFIKRMTKIIKKLYETKVLEQLSNKYRGVISPFILDITEPKCQDPTQRCNCFNKQNKNKKKNINCIRNI